MKVGGNTFRGHGLAGLSTDCSRNDCMSRLV